MAMAEGAPPETPDAASAEAAELDAPETRRRVYATLLRLPGLNLAELARHAGVGESLARYHVTVLLRSDLAHEERSAGHPRFFPSSPSPEGMRDTVDRRDKALLALLRRPGPLRIVLELQVREGHQATMGELARAAGVSPGTATYHVAKLVKLGAILMRDDGRLRFAELVEPGRIMGLLARYPPPRDLVQAFTELWDQAAG
jgi:predicted transcriptional regulator